MDTVLIPRCTMLAAMQRRRMVSGIRCHVLMAMVPLVGQMKQSTVAGA